MNVRLAARVFLRVLLPVSSAAVVAAGCSKIARDLSGLACDEGRCGGAYTCDTVENVCVTTGSECSLEGRTSDCGDGELRVCEGGSWSSCALGGDECVPGSATCDGNTLVRCDSLGYLLEPLACGAFGCNAQATPQRCNECAANQTSCVGLVFTTCSAEGLVTDEVNCETDRVCSGTSTCHPTNGCVPGSGALPGTPCDEDAGAIVVGFCDSSCRGGACVAEPPDCGSRCEQDDCAPATGCLNTPLPVGTPCGAGPGSYCSDSCDGAGNCTGVDATCEGVGPCAECNNGTGACVPTLDTGRVCRPVAGTCDVADYCDGSSTACPATDELRPDWYECRPEQDPLHPECDAVETCTGTSAACPADTFPSGNPVCEIGDGDCDLDDLCSGGACVASVKPAGAPCTNGNGVSQCSAADTCNADGECEPNNINEGLGCTGCSVAPCVCQSGVCVTEGPPTLTITPDCNTSAPCTTCTLTIAVSGLAADPGDIDCTAPRQTLPVGDASSTPDGIADFEGSDEAWDLSNMSRFNWPGVMPASCPQSGQGVYYYDNQSGTLTRYVDSRGYRAIQAEFLAGYDTGNDAPEAGEHIVLNECCGDACGNFTEVMTVLNAADGAGGSVGCSTETSPTFANADCRYLRIRFSYSNDGAGDEYATLDDIEVTGDVIFATVTGSNGTYQTSVRSCVPTSYTVTCTWNDGGTNPFGTAILTFP